MRSNCCCGRSASRGARRHHPPPTSSTPGSAPTGTRNGWIPPRKAWLEPPQRAGFQLDGGEGVGWLLALFLNADLNFSPGVRQLRYFVPSRGRRRGPLNLTLSQFFPACGRNQISPPVKPQTHTRLSPYRGHKSHRPPPPPPGGPGISRACLCALDTARLKGSWADPRHRLRKAKIIREKSPVLHDALKEDDPPWASLSHHSLY